MKTRYKTVVMYSEVKKLFEEGQNKSAIARKLKVSIR